MWWGRRDLRSRGASLAFSLPPRSEQPLGYHVCSLDPDSLPWWVRAPHRPLPLAPSKVEVEAGTSPRAVLSSQVSVFCCCCHRPRAAREPVSCGFPGPGAGLCPGVARGCGPARRNALRWSPWALAGGWSYKGAKVGAAAWRTPFIPTAHLLRLTHFSLGKGLLGSDGDVLHKVRRRKPPPIHTHNPGASSPPSKPNNGSRSGGCSLSPTEERRSPGCSAEFGVRERPSDCQRDRERLRE